jgi:hypothetical protein
MPRLPIALALAAVLVAAVVPAAAEPVAHASKRCSVGDGRGYGTTYVTYLSVSGTSCRNGRRVVRAFHKCRPGKAGHCHHSVLGYSCKEHRYNKISVSYDSTVTCHRGSRRVKHKYTQYT